MSIENLKKSVRDWKETVDANAFADSVGVFAEATVSASPIIDKASTWVAAGTATVAGLAITNIDRMVGVYGDSEIKWLFTLLAISIFFAIVQKYLAISCAASLHVAEGIKQRFPNVLAIYDEHEKQIKDVSDKHNLDIKAEFDFSKVLKAYLNLFPRWALFIFKSQFERSIKDRNYSHQKLVRLFVYQSTSAFVQYLAILVFIFLAAVFI